MLFTDICGNEHAKRAAEVALAGNHSISFIGAHDSQAQDLADLVDGEGHRAKAVAPCPCGYYGNPDRECLCSLEVVAQWQREHYPSRPMDITIEVLNPRPETIMRWIRNGYQDGEPHGQIIERIQKCRESYHTISAVDNTVYSLLKTAIRQLRLTPMQLRSTMGVVNTIANLAASNTIHTAHMAEALQYRAKA